MNCKFHSSMASSGYD